MGRNPPHLASLLKEYRIVARGNPPFHKKTRRRCFGRGVPISLFWSAQGAYREPYGLPRRSGNNRSRRSPRLRFMARFPPGQWAIDIPNLAGSASRVKYGERAAHDTRAFPSPHAYMYCQAGKSLNSAMASAVPKAGTMVQVTHSGQYALPCVSPQILRMSITT